MKNIRYKLIITIFLFGILNLFSCKKDSNDTQQLYSYIPPGNAGYNVTTGSLAILRSSIYSSTLSFPIYLTRAYNNDVKVTAIIDTTFLKVYDSTNKVTSPRFKLTAFNFANNGTVHIPKGETASKDSIIMQMGDSTGLDFAKTYIIPIRLNTSDNIPVSLTRNVMYVKVNLMKITSGVQTGLLSMTAGMTNTITNGPTVALPLTISNAMIGRSVTITAVDDLSLVDAYNTTNKTSYLAMPAGSYTLVQNTATVTSGKTISADSVKVQIPNMSLLPLGKSYLLPIRVKDVGDIVPSATAIKYILVTPVSTVSRIPATGTATTLDMNIGVAPNGTVLVPANIGFAAGINTALNANAKIVIVDDPSLVAAYNTANGKSYLNMPTGTYTISKNSVSINAGSTTSGSDLFNIQLTSSSAFALNKDYLLPVKIVANDATSIPGGTSNNVYYLHFAVVSSNIDPSNTGLAGTSLSKTGWTATASSTYSMAYAASNAIDGANNTSWFSSISSKPYLQINMGSSQTIKGFSIVPNYGAFGAVYDFLTMQVFTSNDGTTWTSQGVYSGTATSSSSNATSPDLKTIKFVAPVNVQYYRLQVLTGSQAYTGIGEVNAIQ